MKKMMLTNIKQLEGFPTYRMLAVQNFLVLKIEVRANFPLGLKDAQKEARSSLKPFASDEEMLHVVNNPQTLQNIVELDELDLLEGFMPFLQ